MVLKVKFCRDELEDGRRDCLLPAAIKVFGSLGSGESEPDIQAAKK